MRNDPAPRDYPGARSGSWIGATPVHNEFNERKNTSVDTPNAADANGWICLSHTASFVSISSLTLIRTTVAAASVRKRKRAQAQTPFELHALKHQIEQEAVGN